ncbi:MAG: glycosyltransferase family 39 protein [Planctomycetota bacterium]
MRVLPESLFIDEASGRRWGMSMLMLAVAVGYFVLLLGYWSPAHPGSNQHGYLTGARNFIEYGHTGFVPETPYEFIGAMYVMPTPENGTVFPKYPAGLSALMAGGMLIADAVGGDPVVGAHLVSPVMATLGLLGVFYLIRPVAGSFAALLGAVTLGCSQVYFTLAVNPNSHATDTALAAIGFALLLRWMRKGNFLVGMLGGGIVGLAATVRYTDGVLGLAVFVACVGAIYWKRPVTYLKAALPLLAWLVPVAALYAHNWYHMETLTGYDSTNESSAFRVSWFVENWERTVRLIHDEGLIFLFGPGVFGVFLLLAKSPRLGLTMLAWLIPSALLYSAYYYAPNYSIAYLRFFMVIMPVIVMGAFFVLGRGVMNNPAFAGRWSQAAASIAAGAVVLLACIVGTTRAAYGNEASLMLGFTLEKAKADNANHASLGNAVRRVAPEGSLVVTFTGGIDGFAQHLQFAGGYELYAENAWSRSGMRSFGWMAADKDDVPNPIDPNLLAFRREHYDGKSSADLKLIGIRTINDALADGRRVFIVTTPGREDDLLGGAFDAEVLVRWTSTPQVFAQAEAEPEDDGRRRGWGKARSTPQTRVLNATRQNYVIAELKRKPAEFAIR